MGCASAFKELLPSPTASRGEQSMKLNRAQRLTAIAVTLATTVFAGCRSDKGLVGGPPQTLSCSLVQNGQSLVAFGAMEGLTLALTVRHQAFGPGNPGQAFWSNANVSQVAGGNLVSSEINGPDVNMRISVANGANANGSFRLQGTLDGSDRSCPLSRTFTFVVTDGNVQIG